MPSQHTPKPSELYGGKYSSCSTPVQCNLAFGTKHFSSSDSKIIGLQLSIWKPKPCTTKSHVSTHSFDHFCVISSGSPGLWLPIAAVCEKARPQPFAAACSIWSVHSRFIIRASQRTPIPSCDSSSSHSAGSSSVFRVPPFLLLSLSLL